MSNDLLCVCVCASCVCVCANCYMYVYISLDILEASGVFVENAPFYFIFSISE